MVGAHEARDRAAERKPRRRKEGTALNDLRSAARDPSRGSLVTAHMLVAEAGGENADASQGGSESGAPSRCARWLSVIKDANLDQVDEGEYLGWVAYNNGNYSE